MELDIVSMLLGQSLGGGGDGAAPEIVGVAGYIGTKELGEHSTLDFTISGYSGMYAAVLCWTRGEVVAPAGASVVYHAVRDLSGYSNHISLVKAKISSDNFTISIGNPGTVRSGAACFILSTDFQVSELSKVNGMQATVTWPAGFSVFVALSGTGMNVCGKWGSTLAPVAYMFPSDMSDTRNSSARCLAGYINAATSGSGLIGNYINDTAGLFVCLHLAGVE